jgi:hypothetical protein
MARRVRFPGSGLVWEGHARKRLWLAICGLLSGILASGLSKSRQMTPLELAVLMLLVISRAARVGLACVGWIVFLGLLWLWI